MKTNDSKIGDKQISINDNLIKNLNIIMISLIFFNSLLIKVNSLSPVEVQIFFDKNKIIIVSIYKIFYLYIFLGIFFLSIFSLKKRIFERKNNLKRITLK